MGGLTAAAKLAKAGHTVTLLEQGDQVRMFSIFKSRRDVVVTSMLRWAAGASPSSWKPSRAHFALTLGHHSSSSRAFMMRLLHH